MQHSEETNYKQLKICSLHLKTVTTLTCKNRNFHSSSLQHASASRCSHSEWQECFLVRDVYTEIQFKIMTFMKLNSLNISFTEGVNASNPKQRR